MIEIILSTLMMLLLPLTMVICGAWFIKSPPEMSSGIGYRTKRSMISADTWIAAHRICGKLWLTAGIVTLVIAILGGVFMAVRETEADSRFFIAILIEEAFQLILMLGSLPLTEIRLKRLFHI